MWLVSHFGLAKFDGRSFKNFYKGKDFTDGLNCVFRDYKNNLWFGGHLGLLQYDYTMELPQEIGSNTTTDLNSSIKFISSIDSSYLILGMLDKIVLLDLKKYYANNSITYTILDTENGFEGEDCIQDSGYKDSKGNIWIATRTMVHKLIPDQIEWNHYPRKVLIDYLISEDKKSKPQRDTFSLREHVETNKKILFKGTNLSNSLPID